MLPFGLNAVLIGVMAAATHPATCGAPNRGLLGSGCRDDKRAPEHPCLNRWDLYGRNPTSSAFWRPSAGSPRPPIAFLSSLRLQSFLALCAPFPSNIPSFSLLPLLHNPHPRLRDSPRHPRPCPYRHPTILTQPHVASRSARAQHLALAESHT